MSCESVEGKIERERTGRHRELERRLTKDTERQVQK